MSDDLPLVWMPFEAGDLGAPIGGLRFDVMDASGRVPDSIADVAYFIPPFGFDAAAAGIVGQMKSLRVVQTLTAGVESIESHVPAGVTLCSGRGIHDTSTAELALTLILSSLRGIPDFVRSQAQGSWAPRLRPALADKRVVIVGYGAIGEAIEARLAPFETEVVRIARTAREGVHPLSDLHELLPAADVVVLTLPLTDQTRALVDGEFLSAMKPGSLLVNVARGAIVDTAALLGALESGHVQAALDVTDPEPLPPEHPLWKAPNLLITPHVGGASSARWPRIRELVRDQLTRFAAGEPLANVVSSAR